jgi:glycosyltransferase involved in cell wall biosynthesis
MKVIVTAKLSDHKLTTKLTGLVNLPSVEEIFIVRRMALPVKHKKIVNINPSNSLFQNRFFFEIWRAWKIFYLCLENSITAIIGIQLILHGFWAVIIGKLTKTPSVISLIGADIHYHSRHRIWGSIIRQVIRRATCVTIMGPRSMKLVSKLRTKNDGIYKALNCQDEERFVDGEYVKKWDLVFIGYLIPRKRVEVIIKAVKHVKNSYPSVRLAIVGNGPEDERLKRLVTTLGLEGNVSFLGEQSNVEEYLKYAKILIIASRIEALPAVALEAMFCGTPCVLTDVCDIPEIFSHERNSLLVDVNDPSGLEKAILRLLSDKILYNNLVEGLKVTRCKYIEQWGVQGQKKLWESILSSFS